MVLDIKMCRFDNVPWGFRLVGGADYDYPLTVVKVTEGSIADEAGLRVEDIIVRINDTAATPLSHDEAHRLIMNSGSVFYFGVYRENEEDAYECLTKFPMSEGSLTKSPSPSQSPSPTNSPSPATPSLSQRTEATNARTPEPEPFVPPPRAFATIAAAPAVDVDVHVLAECRQAVSEVHSEDNCGHGDVPARPAEEAVSNGGLYLPDLPDRPCSALSEPQEIKLVEEEIAAVLSGESEVLKEHNVLGIFPKPGVCMSSDVLRSLNEEVTKTKLEKDKENRQWSTFLQRPNRPVPKSKQMLEAERRAANAYKVTIVKSAPRDKSPMPEAKPAPKETSPAKEEEQKEEPEQDEVVAEQEQVQEPDPEPEKEEEPLPTDSEVPNLEQLPESEVPDEQPEKADAPKEVCESKPDSPGVDPESVETPTVSTPPAEIVSTPTKTDEELALERQLADVQRQLAALSSLPSTIQSTLDAVTKQLADLLPTFKLQQQEKQLPQIDENQEDGETTTTTITTIAGETEDAGKDISISGSDNPLGPCESNEDRCDANDREVAEISRSTGDNRLAKDKKKDLEKELLEQQEPLSEEQTFKKQKIAFWNRLFNGEHITRQRFRELQGLSLGLTMQKVNFMKYQKPERKIDLNRSEVYKYLNPHLDRAPVRGIEVRAPLVAAESDIRQSLQS
ncbi:titin isoform X8 [Drosophila gunungcola]|uniref:titin isoform X8 n=1 Tax=Drosophila gunungcola TaxID=103775 RepID=UPI0022E69118|nr:titin isoform X8 [Drosophila gunungcola]